MPMIFFWLFLGAAFAASPALGNPPSPAADTSLLSAMTGHQTPSLCDEAVPLERQEIRERFEKEFLLTLDDRPQVILWLKRSRRYLPHISQSLKDRQMPDDLKYLAIAESALRPHAGSPKGAMGYWQFMPETARRYGLVVDDHLDQRRNFQAATDAALRYLIALHEAFGSWALAMAAFNMGEEGLWAEILEQETRDYYRLYLPLETQRYIFRILAIKLIFSEPERYGFHLSEADFYPETPTDAITLDCFQEVPIRLIAKAAGTVFKQIKDLNPEIRGHFLEAGRHRLLLPAGTAEGFHPRFEELVKGYLASLRGRSYTVQPGDNLSAIAQKFAVPLKALLIWNRIEMAHPIQPGQSLVIMPETAVDRE